VRWPALAQFLGGYLHQDFDLDATAEEGITRGIYVAERDASVSLDGDPNYVAQIARQDRELGRRGIHIVPSSLSWMKRTLRGSG
jgi:hypothetical protein